MGGGVGNGSSGLQILPQGRPSGTSSKDPQGRTAIILHIQLPSFRHKHSSIGVHVSSSQVHPKYKWPKLHAFPAGYPKQVSGFCAGHSSGGVGRGSFGSHLPMGIPCESTGAGRVGSESVLSKNKHLNLYFVVLLFAFQKNSKWLGYHSNQRTRGGQLEATCPWRCIRVLTNRCHILVEPRQ